MSVMLRTAIGKARRGVSVAAMLVGCRRVPLTKRVRIFRTRLLGADLEAGRDVVKANLCGVQLEIPASIMTRQITESIRQGSYEACEILAFDEIAEPGDVVLEVGTGVGFLAAYMAKDRRIRRVASIEANPELVPVAERTAALNGVDVDVHHLAAGREVGNVSFSLHPDFWASSIETWEGAPTIEVPMRPLDDVIRETGANFVVLDIEGLEYSLVPECHFEGVDKMLIELHPWQADETRAKALFDALERLGFAHEHRDRWGNVHAVTRSRACAAVA